MPRRGRETIRCEHCRLRENLCVCKGVEPLNLSTSVLILMHRHEVGFHTGTAFLARRMLKQCEIALRGGINDKLTVDQCRPEGFQSLVLYPSEDAVSISDFMASPSWMGRPVCLIVPDGSWRQCQKAVRREPALEGIARIKLSPGPPSIYGAVRREPSLQAFSTYEAITRVLGAIHGKSVERILEEVFKRKVQNTLLSKGLL